MLFPSRNLSVRIGQHSLKTFQEKPKMLELRMHAFDSEYLSDLGLQISNLIEMSC